MRIMRAQGSNRKGAGCGDRVKMMATVRCEIVRTRWNVQSSPWVLHMARAIRLFSFAAIAFLLPLSTYAATLSSQEFSELARHCAPDIQPSVIRAVAEVESHLNPLSLRDNTDHESWTLHSLATASALAKDRLKRGHSVDIGLMQINSRNLPILGMGVDDAFDACRALDAAHRILDTAFAVGSSETERQAAILIMLSRYNTGRPLAGIANGYVNQVIAAQNAPSAGALAGQDALNSSPQWNIWGTRGDRVPWIVTAQSSSEFERAGAQSTVARSQGRGAAPPLKEGEPYEVRAYQESEPDLQ